MPIEEKIFDVLQHVVEKTKWVAVLTLGPALACKNEPAAIALVFSIIALDCLSKDIKQGPEPYSWKYTFYTIVSGSIALTNAALAWESLHIKFTSSSI